MKLLIGIPAFNEESTVRNVLTKIPAQLRYIDKVDIIVVDDGSTDNTFAESRQKNTKVLRHLINRGLGGVLKTILTYTRIKNYDILVTFDADGQHNSNDISALIRPIISEKSDVVIGSRWLRKNKVPLSRYIINKFANVFTYLLYGINSSDSQSGLRAFNRKAISSINLHSDGMEVSSEIFQEIRRNGLRFSEIPITAIYTPYSLAKGQKLTNSTSILGELLLRLFR